MNYHPETVSTANKEDNVHKENYDAKFYFISRHQETKRWLILGKAVGFCGFVVLTQLSLVYGIKKEYKYNSSKSKHEIKNKVVLEYISLIYLIITKIKSTAIVV